MTTRPAAVAGLFYPADRDALADQVDALLAGAAPTSTRAACRRPKALIAPHAGYIYSGPVAASAFAPLQRAGGTPIRRVVVIGPSHRVALSGLALPPDDAFATPLGTLPVDRGLAAELAALPAVTVAAAPHAKEHALEVELPFLQRLLGEFELLPLVVGEAAPEQVAAVLEAAWGGDETVIVVSSDLSHYLPYDRARQVDRRTAAAIEELAGPLVPEQACGARAINGLLAVARRRGLTGALLDLRSSGDTAGDRQRVVGYGAFALTEGGASSGGGGGGRGERDG